MFRMAVGQSDEVEPADAIAAAIEACRAELGDLAAAGRDPVLGVRQLRSVGRDRAPRGVPGRRP